MQLARIDASLIHAASAYCSKDQHRPYLQSIRLEPCTDGALVIATNGSTMIVLHDSDGLVAHPLLLPVSTEIIKAAKPNRKESKILNVESDIALGPHAIFRSGNCPHPEYGLQCCLPRPYFPKLAQRDSE